MPLFRACRTSRMIIQLHTHLTGLQWNPLASTKLIESTSNGLEQILKTNFWQFPKSRGLFWSNAVWNGLSQEAIVKHQKTLSNMTEFNSFVLSSILRSCSAINDLGMWKKAHNRIIRSGNWVWSLCETSLLSMYGKLGCVCNAGKIFDDISVWDDFLKFNNICSCSQWSG